MSTHFWLITCWERGWLLPRTPLLSKALSTRHSQNTPDSQPFSSSGKPAAAIARSPLSVPCFDRSGSEWFFALKPPDEVVVPRDPQSCSQVRVDAKLELQGLTAIRSLSLLWSYGPILQPSLFRHQRLDPPWPCKTLRALPMNGRWPDPIWFWSPLAIRSPMDSCCLEVPAAWLGPGVAWAVTMSSTSPTTSYTLLVGDSGKPKSVIRLGGPRRGYNFWISFNRSFIDREYLTKICKVCLAEEGSAISISLLYQWALLTISPEYPTNSRIRFITSTCSAW